MPRRNISSLVKFNTRRVGWTRPTPGRQLRCGRHVGAIDLRWDGAPVMLFSMGNAGTDTVSTLFHQEVRTGLEAAPRLLSEMMP